MNQCTVTLGGQSSKKENMSKFHSSNVMNGNALLMNPLEFYFMQLFLHETVTERKHISHNQPENTHNSATP